MPHSVSATAILLAAGISGRMGYDKTRLLTPEGASFFEYLAEGFLGFGCRPVIAVSRESGFRLSVQDLPVTETVNHHPGRGRSHSIWLGLQQAPAGQACFLQNIDNPYLDNNILAALLAAVHAEGYAVPVFGGKGGHPLVLGSGAVTMLKSLPGIADFREELLRLPRAEVPCSDRQILWNINTPADYEEFLRWHTG